MNFKRLGAAIFVTACLAALLGLGLVLAHWERARRGSKDEPKLQLQATAIKGQTNQSTITVSSGGSEARLLPGDAILLVDGNPFTARIARLLRLSLLETGVIRGASIHSDRTEAPVMSMANGPAFFLRLQSKDLEIGGLVTLKLKGEVHVAFGTAPWASNHSYQTEDTPPVFEFSQNINVQPNIEIRGIATDREELAAREVATKISESLKKDLKSWQQAHSVMPNLPASFYGPYRSAPVLDLPAGMLGVPAISYSGLFSHNNTFWTFTKEGDPVPVFQEVRRTLEASGWKFADYSEGERPYLRATRELATLSVFPEQSAGAAPDPKAGKQTFVVRFDERFTKEERTKALEDLMAAGPADALWAFERMMTSDQREKLLQLPASSPRQYLQLAKIYRQRKDNDKAQSMLQRAAALLSLQMDDRSLSDEIKKAVKEAGGKDAMPPITSEVLQDAGFVEIRAGAEPSELTKHAGEPAYFFYRQKNGKLRKFLIEVRPSSGTTETSLYFVSALDGGKSSSLRVGSRGKNGKWRCDLGDSFESVRVSGFAEEAETPDSYRLSVRLVDDWAEPAGN